MFFFNAPLFAVVDMKNANYSETWTDIVLDGIGYDLRVVRAYNSRSLMNGIFGFGWCSEFESRIRVTAEGGLEITECGSGLEVIFHQKGFNEKSVDETIEKILQEVKKRNKKLKPKYLAKLKKDLKYDRGLKAEFVKQLNLKGKIQKRAIYYANGRSNDRISIKGPNYIRTLPDGSFQIFSQKDGTLQAWHDKNQNFIKISYKSKGKTKQISHISDNNGRKLSFFYRGGKVSEIRGPKNLVIHYSHKNENLIQVSHQNKTEYYRYDNLHNLTQIISTQKQKGSNKIEKTSKKILYNKDKDWVTGFVDEKGCQEKYKYKYNPKNPLNHYWSYVTKICKNKVVNKSVYEFLHKTHAKKKRYLHRAKSNRNGFIIDTIYHPVFGKPLIQTVNNHKVEYSYYSNGLIKQKTSPYYQSSFSYENICKKNLLFEGKIQPWCFEQKMGRIEKSFQKSKNKKENKNHYNKSFLQISKMQSHSCSKQ